MKLLEGPVYDGAILVGNVVRIPGGLEFQSLGTGKPSHQIKIRPAQFRSMLTDNESADFASSSNTIVRKAIAAMRFDPERKINTTGGRFEALMNAAIADGIIDAVRKDELLLGIPV